MQNNILIFGSRGQLGQSLESLVSLMKTSSYNYIFLSRDESDITDSDLLNEVFNKYQPRFIVNCAAYTHVDLAEDFRDDAYVVNAEGAMNLAVMCKKYNCSLIHISTDFVFDGNETHLLKEDDICRPINYYGLSKLKGEQEIKKTLNEHFIIRTSWLYSEFGNNFVKTMLRLAKENTQIKVVNDQIGTPTYARDLAKCIISIIDNKNRKYGLYHYSNEGVASWYDFAKSIFEYANISINVIPIVSSEYKTRAARPSFSVLDKSRVKSTLDIEINHWRDSLIECLKKINT